MRLVTALIAAVAAGAAIGCGLNQEGIAPPANQIFYPGAVQVDPHDDRWLYVVNSNSDLRYNDGTLLMVDVQKAEAERGAPWDLCPSVNYVYPSSSPTGYCCWDALDHNILDCDERAYAGNAVKIGSFGSAIQIQDMDGTNRRLLAGVRGNASITWVAANLAATPPTLECGGVGFVECNQAHLVTQTLDPPGPVEMTTTAVLVPDEPYALALDDKQKVLYVGHLRFGFLSAVNLAADPTLIGAFGGIFPGDVNGSVGVTSLTLVTPGINSGRIYATSRFLPRAGAFAPVSYNDPAPFDPDHIKTADNPTIFLANAGDTFVSPLVGSEARGIQFIPAIHRAFLLQRTPPALVGFDTLDGQNVASDVLEVCSGPTFLYMRSPTNSDPMNSANDQQLFVTCFEAGEVYVIDPYAMRLISIIEVGRGPAGLSFSKGSPKRAYVVGFGANNVSTVDLEPGSPTQYHVIEHIGFPSPVPR
jgi:DNA-binding beta-propeller fold protein YncE